MIPYTTLKKDLFANVEGHLITTILKEFEAHKELLTTIADLQQKLIFNSKIDDDSSVLQELIIYNQAVSKLINDYLQPLRDQSDRFGLPSYFTALETYVSSLAPSIKIEQEQRHYNSLSSDTNVIKFGKFVKRFSYQTKKIPKQIANFFRKIVGKTALPILYNQRDVALQHITLDYYKSKLIARLIPLVDTFYSEITRTMHLFWDYDTIIDQRGYDYLKNKTSFELPEITYDLNAVLEDITNKSAELVGSIQEIEATIFAEYEIILQKAGTFEVRSNSFAPDQIASNFAEVEKKVQKNNERWETTLLLLLDDWDIDLEIYTLVFKTYKFFGELLGSVEKKSKVVTEQLDVVRTYKKESYDNIAALDDIKALQVGFTKEVQQLKTTYIATILKKANSTIGASELASAINNFQHKEQRLLAQISEKRALLEDVDFSKPTAPSSVNYSSPNELISYESWPIFQESINDAKVVMTTKINALMQSLNELGEVSVFNFESAQDILNENKNIEEAKDIALSSLQRNIDKLDSLKEEASNFDVQLEEHLSENVGLFAQKLVNFTKNENILEIRLTIAKAKSLEKSKAFRQKIKKTIVYAIPLAWAFIHHHYTNAKEFVLGYMTRWGLVSKKHTISGELSDFLMEAEKSMEQLPFVYQRLFRSETLQNEALFVGNLSKIKILQDAYEKWKKNRFVAILIVGERGAGKTSLFYFFAQKAAIKTKIVLLSADDTMYHDYDFFAFLNSSFSQEISTLEGWISYFNKGKKRIIVLENLQHLYFRKINGFQILHSLSELIAQTNKKVFWITTCSIYAYDYLDKSIAISEQFSEIIEVDDTSNEIMTEAIVKRHKVSGYGLWFDEPPKSYLNKKYEKSTVEEKQLYLESEFFKDLNKIAKGNFKIAFMYWLRSATKVDGSTIHMRSLKTIDLSFLENLSAPKLFILTSILFHEQLGLSHISELTRLAPAQAQRVIKSLYENGLLIPKGAYYTINTLLYRQITNLLISKNFIH